MTINKESFLNLIKAAVVSKVSDIHLRQDERPCFRVRGDLVPVKMDVLTEADIAFICTLMIKDEEVFERIT
jgi:twitching motility protein PilT